jgi:putative ABC transport system permease protein
VSVVPTTGPLPSLRIVALEIPAPAARSGAAGSGGSVAPMSTTGRLARVDPGFFRALSIPVRAGRDLAETDIAMNPSAIVVNEAFVESVLGGGEAVGRTFRVHGPNETLEELEIVGVMANADVFGRAMIYRSVDLRHSNENPFNLSIRVRGKDPSEMTERVRAIALSVDPSLSFRELMTLDDWIEWEGARDRLLENALVAICAIGVLLSIAGISALMSFTVAQRRREISIRVALGASRGHVVLTVMSRTLKQLGFGAAAGFAIVAMIATDYPKLDGLMLFGGTAFTMIVVGVIAAFGPTREGLKVDPTEALKGE